jgi:hypothetical protein
LFKVLRAISCLSSFFTVSYKKKKKLKLYRTTRIIMATIYSWDDISKHNTRSDCCEYSIVAHTAILVIHPGLQSEEVGTQ